MTANKPHPTFNHVAMSIPSELLGEEARAEILDFYGDVFGWTELPTMTIDGQRLVLRAYNHEQFVFLHADPKPMSCPKGDHFGMSVETPAELDAMLERAEKRRERDNRVEIVDRQTEDHKVVKLHSFYVRFLLPLMVEVQCYEWREGIDPTRAPEAG